MSGSNQHTGKGIRRLADWRLLALALLVLVVLSAWSTRYWTAPVVAVAKVERGYVEARIEERGETRLPRVIEITMPASGRVAEIELEEGDRVSKGQVVAQLVERDIQVALKEAEASVAELQAAVAEAEDEQLERDLKQQADLAVGASAKLLEAAVVRREESRRALAFFERILERTRKLAAEQVRSEDELDRTEVEYLRNRSQAEQDALTAEAQRVLHQTIELLPRTVDDYIARRRLSSKKVQAQLRGAQASLERTLLLIERSRMTSPVDGVVLERTTSNEKSLPAGTVLLRIGDLGQLEVQVDLLTEDALRVPERAVARIDLLGDAREPELRATGFVHRIEPQAFTKVSALGVEQQRVWTIIRFDEASLRRVARAGVGVGFRARVSIVVASKKQAARVPRSALFRSASGKWQVFRVDRNKLHRVDVKLGLQNDQWAEVLEGVSLGDDVLVSPDPELEEGSLVRAHPVASDVIDPQNRAPERNATRP